MPNANIKKVIAALLIPSLLIFSGCSHPNEKKAARLAEAAEVRANGDSSTALALLESLSESYPDDSEILQQIGLVHQDLGNTSEAAFYLGTAHNLAPDNPELLSQAYFAFENANQTDTAHGLLEVFAKANPAAMSAELWSRLGELRNRAQQPEEALAAYMEVVRLNDEQPPVDVAVAIGLLFKKINNLSQAERWLTFAAENGDLNALPALFGLLEIHLNTQDWDAVEKSVSRLDKQFPGALDASEWADVRSQLKALRKAEANAQRQAAREAEPAAPGQAIAQAPANSETPPVATLTATSGKAQIITDLETAEAFANMPAQEVGATKTSPVAIEPAVIAEPEITEPDTPAITFNPSIQIQPADPSTESDEAADSPGQEPLVDYSKDFNVDGTSVDPPEMPEPPPENELLSLEELLIKARKAAAKRKYEDSIGLYWQALGRTNQQADVWNSLSKVYLADGQTKNAATAALEATRLDTENIQYVLDYLRVAQRIKEPDEFIKELEIAHDRFPRSPEITLSLARGYRKISNNDYAASMLYRRFIQLAPNHPMRSEAEAELERIQ